MSEGHRCPTHGAWYPEGTLCPLCISQMNTGATGAASLEGLPRATTPPVSPRGPQGDLGPNKNGDAFPEQARKDQSPMFTRHENKGPEEGFGGNDTPQEPQRPSGKKKIGPEDTVWFGKHKGVKAKYVDPTYWLWASENLNWLEVSPELRGAGK